MKYDPIYYGDYLQLDKILGAQHLKSKEHGKEAHDETLFIIIHQTYELWFKQIIHELESIYKIFNHERIRPKYLSTVAHRINRIIEIQRVLNDQLKIIETMTPLDFMEFRDYLIPASGFQSVQFRTVEIMMGLKQEHRLGIDAQFFNSRLNDEDKKKLMDLEKQKSLLELLDDWLSRMPFARQENFDFWEEYQNSIQLTLDQDENIIKNNKTLTDEQKNFELKNLSATRETFTFLFDDEKYQKLLDQKLVKLSRKAKLSAIFIRLYKDLPLLQLPNLILTGLIDIDEEFTTWRYKHSIMAHRMLGAKIGTGGSAGHDYLKRSAENNRVYTDLFDLATYLLPKERVPKLPFKVWEELNFAYED